MFFGRLDYRNCETNNTTDEENVDKINDDNSENKQHIILLKLYRKVPPVQGRKNQLTNLIPEGWMKALQQVGT